MQIVYGDWRQSEAQGLWWGGSAGGKSCFMKDEGHRENPLYLLAPKEVSIFNVSFTSYLWLKKKVLFSKFHLLPTLAVFYLLRQQNHLSEFLVFYFA